ncbi:hypothetical protein HPB52_018919 [Rhipicephalus sanguineus]|uniref:Uncharacterized protein n=1 Tax=Rhipicephalus sanguineus TaxID=34632 RepID=A0A9D4T1C3_RHISA|nr:hypothetical protein HPB52_018919 [Rhipicephalus sanguineus]
MVRGRSLGQKQRQHDNQTWIAVDKVLPGGSYEFQDMGNRKRASNCVDGVGVPWSASLLDFDVAPLSISGFPVVPLPSLLLRNSEDKPAIGSGTAYIPGLFECAEIDFQDRSALYGYTISVVQQAKRARFLPQSLGLERGRNMDSRETRAILAGETHTGFDDNALLHSRNTENCGNAQLDLLAVEHDLWEDLRGAHYKATEQSP